MRVAFWKRAYDFPPCLVRLLARHKGGRPLTDTEIADRTDRITGPPGILVVLAPIEIGKIALSTSWKGIDVYDMQAFLIGCGIDFCNAKRMKRIDSYIRSNPTWKYLRTDKEWLTRWEPMIKRWMESQ